MCYMARFLSCALVALAVLPVAQAKSPDGMQLFTHRWRAGDPESPDGDGLGPMRNASSCVACHHQGGIGGGGARRENVDLLSAERPPLKKMSQAKYLERLTEVHPSFTFGVERPKSTILLHQLGSSTRYPELRGRFGTVDPWDSDPTPPTSTSSGPCKSMWSSSSRLATATSSVRSTKVVRGIVIHRSQRNTPALWGAGLVDAIPDDVIEAAAARQQREESAVSGRVPRADDGGIGRFGWRGQTATLRQFVMGACANELGLQVEGHAQPADPLNPKAALSGVDLSEEQVTALVSFVASLPRPNAAKRLPDGLLEKADRGSVLFEKVGCANCHPRRMGSIDGLYSDMLLHDLGEDLADRAVANPPLAGDVPSPIRVSRAKLSGEWRTPPLWGVKDSGPYLHDGRASTLKEAILLHDSEALASRERFEKLSSDERNDLIGFLLTLSAPSDAPRLAGRK